MDNVSLVYKTRYRHLHTHAILIFSVIDRGFCRDVRHEISLKSAHVAHSTLSQQLKSAPGSVSIKLDSYQPFSTFAVFYCSIIKACVAPE